MHITRTRGRPWRLAILASVAFSAAAHRRADAYTYANLNGTGSNPSTQCVQTVGEAGGVVLNSTATPPVKIFGTFAWGYANFSTTTWNSFLSAPIVGAATGIYTGALWSDTWAGSVDNFVYESTIGVNPVSGTCTAMSVTPDTYLTSNGKTMPFRCINNATNDDNPAFAVAGAPTNLFAAVTTYNTGLKLYLGKNCTPGAQVGCCIDAPCDNTCATTHSSNESCPITSAVNMPHGGDRPTVDINPCTGHAVSSYFGSHKSDKSWTLYLVSYDADGNKVGDKGLQSGLFHNDQVGCTSGQVLGCNGASCDGAALCDDDFTRPQLRIKKRRDGACYAYVAYDYTTQNNGQWFYKVRLNIYDLGTAAAPKEGAPVLVKSWQTTDDRFTWNQWKPELIVSNFNDAVGLFWYSDIYGACQTLFEGAKDTAGAVTNLSALGQVGPNKFPTQNYNTRGMGEYQNGALYGSPDGNLYPMWTQGVPTSASCNSCTAPNGTNWSLATQTTQVIP